MWEGLGYYSRARHLHQIAKSLEEKEFKLPSDYKALRAMKGIGDYTANAILAFAYQKPVIALDGNVLRVGARFLGLTEDIKSLSVKKGLENFFNHVDKPDGRMAEALIELGALVCKQKPLCSICPLNNKCRAFQDELTEVIPLKTPKKSLEKIESQIVILRYENQVLIKKQSKKLMKDLYEFPKQEEINMVAITLLSEQSLTKIKRHFTRFVETLYPTIKHIKTRVDLLDMEWIDYDQLRSLPFSSGHRTIRDKIFASNNQ
jgi:A/G-specific adenine glycosylase